MCLCYKLSWGCTSRKQGFQEVRITISITLLEQERASKLSISRSWHKHWRNSDNVTKVCAWNEGPNCSLRALTHCFQVQVLCLLPCIQHTHIPLCSLWYVLVKFIFTTCIHKTWLLPISVITAGSTSNNYKFRNSVKKEKKKKLKQSTVLLAQKMPESPTQSLFQDLYELDFSSSKWRNLVAIYQATAVPWPANA